MKDTFCAKQFSLCRITTDLIRWANMNSGCCWRYKYILVSMPRVLYQTNRHDHEKLQRSNVAALCQSDQRRFYDDETCEMYILRMLGPQELAHSQVFMIATHLAVLFGMCSYFLRVESMWTSILASWNHYHVFSASANVAVF